MKIIECVVNVKTGKQKIVERELTDKEIELEEEMNKQEMLATEVASQ